MDIHETVEKCKKILIKHYGHRLSGVLLYGSVARGDSDEGSDIDMLVLLNGNFHLFHEIKIITEILYPVQLDSDLLISAKPVSAKDYDSGSVRLFRMAKKEGVLV